MLFIRAISDELASVYQEVFSDENKKNWEDNKNSGLKAFLEQKLSVVWDGSSTWECDTGFVYCYYNAKIKVAPLKDKLNTSLIDEKLKVNPFFSDEKIAKVYEENLINYLDHDFNYYCTADDYYQPFIEDYDLNDSVKNGVKSTVLKSYQSKVMVQIAVSCLDLYTIKMIYSYG